MKTSYTDMINAVRNTHAGLDDAPASPYLCDCIELCIEDRNLRAPFLLLIKERIGGRFSVPDHLFGKRYDHELTAGQRAEAREFRNTLLDELETLANNLDGVS